jgi:hypothetical protein
MEGDGVPEWAGTHDDAARVAVIDALDVNLDLDPIFDVDGNADV